MLLLVVSLVGAADFTKVFNDNVQIVSGRSESSDHAIAATNVVLGLKDVSVDNRMDDEVVDYSTDLVLLGDCSQNKVVSKYFDCSFDGNFVKLIEDEGRKILLLVGKSDSDLVELSKKFRSGALVEGGNVLEEEPISSDCVVDGKGLEVGDAGSLNGKPVYCSSEGLKNQKEVGDCAENYECFDGTCVDSLCEDLAWYVKLWNWVKSLF